MTFSRCPWLVKIFFSLWICVVINIIAQVTYLHIYIPSTSTSNSKTNDSGSQQPSNLHFSTLKQFYSDVNQHNTYLNPINVNNESVVYQLFRRILTHKSKPHHLPLIESILSRFKFSLLPSTTLCKSSDIQYACYKITQQHKNDFIHIDGDCIPSIISGLSYFLSTYWMVSISWNGDNIHYLLDEEYLALVINNTPDTITIYASRAFEYTYYKNPCTDSYSMVWWNWERWEKELDWMSLQHINLLLLPTLNELIEYQLYTDYGLTNDELSTYFVGPAFLAWFRMGNLRGWPPFYRTEVNHNKPQRVISMTAHWLQQQLILSYRIIARCIELGIDIILPGFSGHVPTALTQHIEGNFYDGSRWFGMPKELTYLKFLDPTDDLYVAIGLKYQRIQYEIISSFLRMKHDASDNHRTHTIFLWLDQFNELTPKSDKLDYLQEAGRNQLRSLQLKEYYASAKQSVVKIKWMIQGWMFVHMRRYWTNDKIRHYLNDIPSDDILILDLIAEKGSIAQDSDHFFQHDYIWCFLHNFGGGYGLSGNLENIFKTLATHERNAHWKGIGISMEGIHNNPILYHAVLHHSFAVEDEMNTMDAFVEKYVSSRYGKIIFDANHNEILQIWKALNALLYKSLQGKWSVTKSLIVKRPSNRMVSGESECKMKQGSKQLKCSAESVETKQTATGFQTTIVDYPVCKLFVVWDRWIAFVQQWITQEEDKDNMLKSTTLASDIVEVTRQLLSDVFQQIYLLWNQIETKQSKKILQAMMLGIIDDIDEILSDFKYFRLDEWIQNARKLGKDEEEKDYLEWNARNLVTRWGPNGEINDYSSREWNGLMSSYYKIRWEKFFNRDDVSTFEKKWQKQIMKESSYSGSDEDLHAFYTKIFAIHQKYKTVVDCA